MCYIDHVFSRFYFSLCDGNTRVCTRFSLFTPYRTCIKTSVVTVVMTKLVVTAVTTNINRNKDVASFQRPKIVVHFGQCQTKNSELRDEGW